MIVTVDIPISSKNLKIEDMSDLHSEKTEVVKDNNRREKEGYMMTEDDRGGGKTREITLFRAAMIRTSMALIAVRRQAKARNQKIRTNQILNCQVN